MNTKTLLLCGLFALNNSGANAHDDMGRIPTPEELQNAQCDVLPSLPRIVDAQPDEFDMLHCQGERVIKGDCEKLQHFLDMADSVYGQLPARDPEQVEEHIDTLEGYYEEYCGLHFV